MAVHPKREKSAVPHQGEELHRGDRGHGICRASAGDGVRRRGDPGHRHRHRRDQDSRAAGREVVRRGRPVRVGEARGRRGAVHADHRLLGGGDGGHGQHLRPDAAAQDEGSGPLLHRRRDGAPGGVSPQGDADRPREHHVPRDDAGGPRPDGGGEGVQGGKGHLPRLLAGAGRSRERAVHDEEHPEGGGRRDARVHEGGGGALQRRARKRPPGVDRGGGRDGEAAREHVPVGEHRAGERDRADVRTGWGSTCGR